jgi:hypothetical protein
MSSIHVAIAGARSTCGRARVLLPVSVAVATLAGCGGGGGGGAGGGGGGGGSTSFGNTLPPSSGPGDVEAFFPNANGNVWYYDARSTPQSGAAVEYFDTVTVTGQKTVLGQPATIFFDTTSESLGAGTENYYYKNNGGVAYVGDNDPTDSLSVAMVPYIEALFPVAAGTVARFSKSGVNMGDLDGDLVNDTANLSFDVTIVGFEALDTQLGSFARTAHSTERITGNITLSSNHATVPLSATHNIWSAAGVGIVRRTLSTTVQNETQQDSFEARGYVIDGVGRGLSVPYSVRTNLAPGSSDISTPGRASLACDGAHCLAMSASTAGLVGTLFDVKGATVASVNLGAGGPSATVFDGSNYLVVDVSAGQVRAHRVSMAGASLDGTNGIVLATTSTSGLNPAAAPGSANTLVVYSKFDNALNQHLLYGILVDRSGQAIVPGEFAIAVDNSTHLYPAAAFDGANYFVVWRQQTGSGTDSTADVYGVRVDPTGTVLDAAPMVVSSAANGQYGPSVAFDGTNFLVVWLDGRSLSGAQNCGTAVCEIFGARVTPSGALLDGPATSGGIGISTGGTQPRDDLPSVAFNGTEFLVAWATSGFATSGSTGIRLARVAPGGVVISTPASGIGVSGAPPSSTTSLYALPVLAPNHQTSPGACIAWLDNTESFGSEKQLLAATSYAF